MRIIIIAEEELTHKDLVGFKNNFAMSGLGRLLDILFDENVNALAAIFAVANPDGMPIVARMNARTLRRVVAVDVEDFGVAWCNAPGRLLTYPAH